MKLRLSTLPPFDALQRWCSRLVWGFWFGLFAVFEFLGCLHYTPWRTLSETAWDLERRHPGRRAELEAFLLGLVVHIRYRDTLESSVLWGAELEKRFDDFVRRTEQ